MLEFVRYPDGRGAPDERAHIAAAPGVRAPGDEYRGARCVLRSGQDAEVDVRHGALQPHQKNGAPLLTTYYY